MRFKSLILGIFLTTMANSNISAQDIALPRPQTQGGKPLMEALSLRKSTRQFDASFKMTDQQLSDMLWATCGYNRADKLTVATAMNKQGIYAYLITPEAVYQYDAKGNKLVPIVKGDFRKLCAMQEFAQNAPYNVALATDSSEQTNSDFAAMSIGAMSQNLYLWCASEGIGTVVRASFDHNGLAKAMKLPSTRKIQLIQTLGK